MNLDWLYTEIDPKVVASSVGALASSALAVLGVRAWLERRNVAKLERWAKKADLSDVVAAHERISKLTETDGPLDRNYKAVLDLYRKDERTKELLLETERRNADRHTQTMGELLDISKRLPPKAA